MSEFRQINEIENKIILNSLSAINSKLPLIFDDNNIHLYISFNKLNSRDNFPLIYLLTNDQRKTLKILNLNNSIYAAGLYFGFIKKSNYYLSLEGAEFLYRSEIFADFKLLFVNENGEKSILYGNNVLKRMVINEPSNLLKGDFLLVFNKINEIIAIAKVVINLHDTSNIEPNKIIAINLNDKGGYLRKKQ
ncbi:MAG: hypothetical protein ACXABO_13725 [Promethearchaeota archaeon]|jgi:ribosome biogenesis protein Nip4